MAIPNTQSSIAFMETFMDKCLKASSSWYMTDICSVESRSCLYFTGTNGYISPNINSCGSADIPVFGAQSVSSGSYNKSFSSGIRRSGCRVPF